MDPWIEDRNNGEWVAEVCIIGNIFATANNPRATLEPEMILLIKNCVLNELAMEVWDE